MIRERKNAAGDKKRRLTDDVKSRIESSYAEPLDVGSLAAAFFISKTYLQHTFKADTGCTVTRYINKTRVENSKLLLAGTELKISEISAKVGITDYNYFSRIFKKYTGMTPLEFRKAQKLRDDDF